MRGYAKHGVIERVREAGGEVYAITSEPQTLASAAQDDWQTGMVHVGDPHQEILAECRRRGWLSLFVTHWGDDLITREWVSHPKGYYQPGVLALNEDERVLYRWRCRPTRKNIGGAIARPTAKYVFAEVERALAADSTTDAPLDDAPELDARDAPWPLFVGMLLANGWFLRPLPFDQRPGEDTVPARQKAARHRLLGFVILWIALAIALPAWLTGTLFAAWALYITPGVLKVHRRFQNIGPDQEP